VIERKSPDIKVVKRKEIIKTLCSQKKENLNLSIGERKGDPAIVEDTSVGVFNVVETRHFVNM
jgi:hypothetical protein